jgi:hypothetical protein
MAEFLHDCGVRVLYRDRDMLAAGVEELLKLWELGQLQVSSSGSLLCRKSPLARVGTSRQSRKSLQFAPLPS